MTLQRATDWKSNLVITEDHYIDYFGGRLAEEVVPVQILAKLRQASCLFLGSTDGRLAAAGYSCTGSGGRGPQRRHALGGRTRSRRARAACSGSVPGSSLYRNHLTDYVPGFDRFLTESVRRADMSEIIGTGRAPRQCPYFGLDYYEEKFGAWFFGREADRQQDHHEPARRPADVAACRERRRQELAAARRCRVADCERVADDSFARRGTARFIPIVFSSWKDDPVMELAPQSARRSGRTWRNARSPSCRPTGSTRPSRRRRMR